MHRQREHLAGELCGDGEVIRPVTQVQVCFLHVSGHRVIDHCRYALVLKTLPEGVALDAGYLESVLLEDML